MLTTGPVPIPMVSAGSTSSSSTSSAAHARPHLASLLSLDTTRRAVTRGGGGSSSSPSSPRRSPSSSAAPTQLSVTQAQARPNKPVLRRSTLSGTVRKFAETDLDEHENELGEYRGAAAVRDHVPRRGGGGRAAVSVPSSPSKRLRVSFNPTVEERLFEAPREQGRSDRRESVPDDPVRAGRTWDSVRAQVRRALEAHKHGDDEDYEALRRIFARHADARGDALGHDADGLSEEPDEEDEESVRSPAELRLYLSAITSYAQLLGRNFGGLVANLLNLGWTGMDESLASTYITFLGTLASAHGWALAVILRKLVHAFLGIRPAAKKGQEIPTIAVEQRYGRIHAAIRHLLRLLPVTSAALSPILDSTFPAADLSKRVHLCYITHLLQLTEYAPELRSEVLALIMDRLVKIDVQVQIDLDNADDEVSLRVGQALLQQRQAKSLAAANNDSQLDEDSDADSDLSDDESDSEIRRAVEITRDLEKLDAIIDLMFTTYSTSFRDTYSIEATTTFSMMLSHFANIILPTYRSRHVQFLLFHFAQTSDALIDNFAGTCVQLSFQVGRPSILRQACAAYLASFVARGAHVKTAVVRDVYELIGSNLEQMRIEHEPACRGPDLHRYGTFYAMTQALLYIFCFRWRDLIVSPHNLDEDDDPSAYLNHELIWLSGIKETLSRTIYSRLNPLKVCSPAIVSEFARIAHHLGFLYVYPLLETNKRIRLSQYAGSAATAAAGLKNGAFRDSAGAAATRESWHQLESYFPFDPYQLPVSKRWIEKDYVVWQGVPGMAHEEEGDSSEAESEEDEEEDEDGDGEARDGREFLDEDDSE